MSTVAFIGLGAMGAPMATNLREAGFDLRVYNRHPAKAERFAAMGAVVCRTPGDAVRGAQFVVSIVSDDVATREVMLGPDGVLHAAGSGTIIVDSSTNTPAMAREVAERAGGKGCWYLDAPVSGSVPQSKSRELVFMVGGDAAAFEKARPVFDAMGRMARLMGRSGAGATLKLVNNMLSGTMNAAIAEAMTVAEAAGIDPEAAQAILAEGAAGCRLMRTKIPKIASRDFSPQFQLGLMEKDLRYFLALAQGLDRPTPITSLVRSQMQSARLAGLGGLDVSAIFLHVTGEKPRG